MRYARTVMSPPERGLTERHGRTDGSWRPNGLVTVGPINHISR